MSTLEILLLCILSPIALVAIFISLALIIILCVMIVCVIFGFIKGIIKSFKNG